MRKLILPLALLTAALVMAEPNFDRVDRHALSASASDEKSLDSLARYLCPPSYTERQKARSVFRWVADRISYDLDALRQNDMPSQEPEDVLKARRAVCAGYSLLFQALAQRGGLKVEYVSGDSQFNDQLPFKLPKNARGHGWNAVFINGEWNLVDVTWAAGAVDGVAFKKSYEDFWFCPPPQQFIFTHLPKDPRWQLLSSPWERQRFQKLPQVRPNFFRLGISPDSLQPEPLEVSQELVLHLKAPNDTVGISQLRAADRKPLPEWTFSQSPAGFLETRVRCPKAGSYSLYLFGNKRQPAWKGNLENPDQYPGIAQFTVTCRRPADCPFPRVYGSFQRAGAELIEPFDGQLPAHSFQRFRVRVPNAEAVMAFAGKEPLGELQAHDGVYEARLHLPRRGVPVQLCAKFAQESRYWGLVEYDLR